MLTHELKKKIINVFHVFRLPHPGTGSVNKGISAALIFSILLSIEKIYEFLTTFDNPSKVAKMQISHMGADADILPPIQHYIFC